MTAVALSACALAVALAGLAVALVALRRTRAAAAVERRVEAVELSVVRSVLEENPGLVDKVLDAQKRLYHGGGFLNAEKALKEARRLHGLER